MCNLSGQNGILHRTTVMLLGLYLSHQKEKPLQNLCADSVTHAGESQVGKAFFSRDFRQ